MGEDFGNEVDQVLNLYGDHMRIFTLSLVSAPAASSAAPCSRAGFHDRLGRHFERKIAGVSMASTMIGADCLDSPSRYASCR